jgi:hypothetical protein
MRRFGQVDKNYWWITAHASERGEKSALVPITLARKEGDFSRVRQIIWHWYRSEVAGNESLSMTARFVGWA